MFCSRCGKELADTSEFCAYCGAQAGTGAAQAGPEGQPPATPGPPAYAPPPSAPADSPAGVVPREPPAAHTPPGPPAGPSAGHPVGPPGQPGPYPPPERPKKKSPLPWVLGGLGLLAVVAVVLVLVFVIFGGEASGPDVSAAEQVVEDFFKSWEMKDVDMFVATLEPSFRVELKESLGEYYDLFFEYFFEVVPDDLEVTIRKMETTISGDKAVVTVVDGTMTYTDEDGVKVSEEASGSDMADLQLSRVDGKWYLDSDSLRKMGFDLEELASLIEFSSSFGDWKTIEDTIKVEIDLPIDSKEEAFSALLEVPELSQWYWGGLYPAYQVTEEDNRYVFYLFNQPYMGDATPYGWYAVDKETGAVSQIANE